MRGAHPDLDGEWIFLPGAARVAGAVEAPLAGAMLAPDRCWRVHFRESGTVVSLRVVHAATSRQMDAGATHLTADTGRFRRSYGIGMRFEDDPQTAEWLESLMGASDDFEWDVGKVTKLAKHGVVVSDVESMLRSPLFFAGRITDPAHEEHRWLVLGQSSAGRRLALIMTRRGSTLRPISCRPMRKEERKLYEESVLREKEDSPRQG
jgi:uncharacterized DUF497 family protein